MAATSASLDAETYPFLSKYAAPVKRAEREIVGRDREIQSILAAFHRPELCNVILLAPAGSGKTALVQGVMAKDSTRVYLEVDMARMIADLPDTNQMAARLKVLFDETAAFNAASSREIVLFMDEFHQVVQLSSAAVEALKPLLADSGTRGIRVIAATTNIEFRQYISSNQPLVERLQRINLKEPDRAMTVAILRGMAERYGVDRMFKTDRIFELIYEYTERYVPANAQPRKSILVLDSMVGWHRATHKPIDVNMLARVLEESEGVNVAFNVNAGTIKERLDAKVFAQDYATSAIEERLQICVADLNDHDKPMSTFLFTGSTGVGKLVSDDTPVPSVERGTGRLTYVNHGDLKVGDIVFDMFGSPTRVLGTFPHTNVPMYRVTLFDGRTLDVGDRHLWSVYTAESIDFARRMNMNSHICPLCMTTEEMVAAGVLYETRDGGIGPRWFIPANGAVQTAAMPLDEDPYVVGADATDGLPDEYMAGSIGQRWSLVQGLFDVHGDVSSVDGVQVVYETRSESLATDVLHLLRSLGLQCDSMMLSDRHGDVICSIRVRCSEAEIARFFRDGKKSSRAKTVTFSADHVLDLAVVGIVSIEPIGTQDAQCIYVDNPEHLYQAGEFVVTHNTEVTKQLVNILFGDPRALLRFDMTEYSNADSLERFRDELTARVWARPYSVVLLDEVEKSCGEVTRLLLQVLDDARLSDKDNREVSFKNCYIIMTTNAGSEIYQTIAQYNSSNKGDRDNISRFEKVIRRSIQSTTGANKFPPELLGRIDTIVPFQPLSYNTMERIVLTRCQALRREVARKHGVELHITREIVRYLIEDKSDTDASAGGARAVISNFETEIVTPVARFLNANPQVRKVGVFVQGEMTADNKNQLISQARIVVNAVK